MKITLGLVLGLLIGAGCRLAGIPVPSPQELMGAFLGLAMTIGYIATDQFASHREARHRQLCGGPTGAPES
jgi:XapX domain-containing protein